MLIRLGLLIYAFSLFTSFMHVWEVYARFGGEFPVLDRVWVALGVALGLDLTAIYYSYLSVLGVKTAKVGSYFSVGLVWFAVLISLLTGTHTLSEKVIVFVLSLFVLASTFFLGRVLGELAGSESSRKSDRWITTQELAKLLGTSKTSALLEAKRAGLTMKVEGKSYLWNEKEVYAYLQHRNARHSSDGSPSDNELQ